MKVVVTGGAGFIGSHVCEFYARQGYDVTCLDNFSRGSLLGQNIASRSNWDWMKKHLNPALKSGHKVVLANIDVRDAKLVRKTIKRADLVVHCAAQTSVPVSISNPELDFSINTAGTLNVLNAVKDSGRDTTVVFCSTNKVYGGNAEKYKFEKRGRRYDYAVGFAGINESCPVDGCGHSPYGISKLAADLYVQEFSHTFDVRTAVFRQSCVYGPRQLGVEEQGWATWFVVAALLGKKLNIYGDGCQVRDMMYVTDAVMAFDKFYRSDLRHGVWNLGGGTQNTVSLLEAIDIINELTGKRLEYDFGNWRMADQKIYVSDIRKAMLDLNWVPLTSPKEGLMEVCNWAKKNLNLWKKSRAS